MTPTAPSTGRILIVSNRLPVTASLVDGRLVVTRSSGGLATGLARPHERSGGLWIGWPGNVAAGDPHADDPHADDAHAEELRRELASLRLVPVSLSASEVDVFYERVSNAVLWPLFHDRLDRLPLAVEGWDVYDAVNARFADVVAAQYRPGDTIWVHDYQLLRLPALLRERIPHARIGFFLHIPFPPADLFATLAPRRWLLEGLLGADLIGFHTHRYLHHFRDAAARLLGLPHDDGAPIEWRGRAVRVGVFPMGVDAAALASQAEHRDVTAAMHSFRGDRTRLLLGVDRLDYSKGIPRRLLAIERLLQRHPEWHERVRLTQVAVPSRGGVDAYRRFRDQVNALVGRINGEFATPTWTPVQYIHRSVSSTTLLALYRAADVMLVTPVRDGMNLVAKEFVAARIDEDGVLVLSEFAGAAAELSDAVLVNPYDLDGTADAIDAALRMDGAQRRRRMWALRRHVMENDVHRWAASFIDALGGAGAG